MKPFVPHELPIKNLDWAMFVSLIGEANRELAKFDAALNSIPEPNVLLSPLTTNEAVLSSRIEGTQATLEDVYKFEAAPKERTEKYDDIIEIINYRRAITEASEKLNRLPLSSRLIREIHKTLLSGARGKNKTPGKFRTGQVYIGQMGTDIGSATFVPPEPQTISEHFSNFEKYIHFNEKDVLVQLAIVHAQFEIIHPFWDGNGRTGRIIMPLFLYYKKIIGSPNFYLSEYFEKNRDSYNSGLNSISETGKWEKWITYFLKAIIVQSAINREKVESILALYKDMMNNVQNSTHSQYTHKVVDFIFSNPWFDTIKFREESKVAKSATSRIIRILLENNILKVIRKGIGRRPTVYVFPELLKIIR
ncbi:Fic family protein [bacterium]|nr:Fic family protein [bacterium]